jgi:hypothetical protein
MILHCYQQIVTLKDFGQTGAMGLRYMIMKKVLNKHILGDFTMEPKGISSLSEDDLKCLEKIVAAKFSEECEYSKTFGTKNGWNSNVKANQLLRIMNSIRSTKHSKKIKDQRW